MCLWVQSCWMCVYRHDAQLKVGTWGLRQGSHAPSVASNAAGSGAVCQALPLRQQENVTGAVSLAVNVNTAERRAPGMGASAPVMLPMGARVSTVNARASCTM